MSWPRFLASFRSLRKRLVVLMVSKAYSRVLFLRERNDLKEGSFAGLLVSSKASRVVAFGMAIGKGMP